jgi:hypothetical protein
MALQVIGAGFGRTGTLSLKAALEKLGLGPCYHMVEVGGNEGHAQRWIDAMDGRPDWHALLGAYGSTVDWPGCHYWRELAASHPDARVLLSVRDPDRWYESVMSTIYNVLTMTMPEDAPAPFRLQQTMVQRMILDETFGGRLDDRAHAIDVYQRHNAAVREAIAPDRLLVFEVAEGWEKLCSFLDRPVPEEDFPRLNDSASFRDRFSGAFAAETA